MSTLFLAIIALLGLVVAGFFFPFLWILAAIVLVLGLVYMWRMGREAAGDAPER